MDLPEKFLNYYIHYYNYHLIKTTTWFKVSIRDDNDN